MKTKLPVLALAALLAGLVTSMAGPAINVSVNPGVCAPVRSYCPPVVRCAPRYYSPGVSFYSWGPSVVMASSGPNGGFTNVSTMMNYTGSAPVYQVPAPVLPAQPVVVYPSSPFSWKR